MNHECEKLLGVYSSQRLIEEMDRKYHQVTSLISPEDNYRSESLCHQEIRYHQQRNMGRSFNEKGPKE